METVVSLMKTETLGQGWSGLCAGVNICNVLPRSLPVTCKALAITHPCSSPCSISVPVNSSRKGRKREEVLELGKVTHLLGL